MVNNTYPANEIFKDIEGDAENVLMNIPPEIAAQMGWEPGDTLKVTADHGVITIIKVKDGKE